MKTLVAACLLLLAPASRAATWIVDAAGGGQFTSIQAAIDAAAPGDVLLVQSGFYQAFTLDKDLSILGTAVGSLPYVAGESHLLMDNAEIAQHLAVAISTVKAHINHIFGKLGVHNRLEAVLRAQELDLL